MILPFHVFGKDIQCSLFITRSGSMWISWTWHQTWLHLNLLKLTRPVIHSPPESFLKSADSMVIPKYSPAHFTIEKDDSSLRRPSKMQSIFCFIFCNSSVYSTCTTNGQTTWMLHGEHCYQRRLLSCYGNNIKSALVVARNGCHCNKAPVEGIWPTADCRPLLGYLQPPLKC